MQQCLTPDRRRGGCVDLRQCAILYQLIQKPGISPEERNFLRQSQCAYFDNYPWVSQLNRTVSLKFPLIKFHRYMFRFVVHINHRIHNLKQIHHQQITIHRKNSVPVIFHSPVFVDFRSVIVLLEVTRRKSQNIHGWC